MSDANKLPPQSPATRSGDVPGRQTFGSKDAPKGHGVPNLTNMPADVAQLMATTGEELPTPAELAAAVLAERARRIDNLDLGLPAFRDSSTQERIEAEQWVRKAQLARRREHYAEAEVCCRTALTHTPGDAAILELLGDILQNVARVDEALAAYRRATKANPQRGSAERKYADLLMRQQDWGAGISEDMDRNPWIAVMLSLIFPGTGQLYNGETGKGAFLILGSLLCICLLAWSPLGFAGRRLHSGIALSQMALVAFTLALYIVSVIDARGSFRRTRSGKSGWDL